MFSVIATTFYWLIFSLVLVFLDLTVAGIGSCFGASFKMLFVRGLWVLLLPMLLYFYGRWVERNMCCVQENTLSVEGLPSALDGYRIVQLSDLHLASYVGRERALQRVVDAANRVDADLMLVTGDLVTASPDELVAFMPLLSTLQARDGVYSIMGNHDYMYGGGGASADADTVALAREERRLKALQAEMGWHMLNDSCVNFANGLSLIGVENISEQPVFPSRGHLREALNGATGSYKVLMMHDPSPWTVRVVGKSDVDLTLSGHTHAAQISLLGFSPSRLMYKQNWGLYRASADGIRKVSRHYNMARGEQLLHVSSGCGETGLMARIGVPPEVIVITLKSK